MGKERLRRLALLATIGGFTLLGVGTTAAPAPDDEAVAAPGAAAVATRTTVEGGVQIEIVSVILPDRKPNGRSWDIAGGPPDPQVRIHQDGFLVLDTAVARDTYEAAFQVTSVAQLDPSRPFAVEVFDHDPSASDLVARVTIPQGARRARLPQGGIVIVDLSDPAELPRVALEQHLRMGEAYADPPGPLEQFVQQRLRSPQIWAIAARRLANPDRVVILLTLDPDEPDPGTVYQGWGRALRAAMPGDYEIVIAAMGEYSHACHWPMGEEEYTEHAPAQEIVAAVLTRGAAPR